MNNGDWIENIVLGGLFILLIVALTLGLASIHYGRKACTLKGGVYAHEICFKKESIYE